jgi:hypothetical protein
LSHSEITAANVHFSYLSLVTSAATRTDCPRFATNNSTPQTICAVYPVVQPEAEAVDTRLVISGIESAEQFFDHIGAAIAIRVFSINDVGRGAD